MAKINQYILNESNNFSLVFDKEITNVTDISLKCSTFEGVGVKFYINDSPYPITIYDINGLWQSDFEKQVDIYKIRICPPQNRDLEFYLSMTSN